jgi:hypothetical protein
MKTDVDISIVLTILIPIVLLSGCVGFSEDTYSTSPAEPYVPPPDNVETVAKKCKVTYDKFENTTSVKAGVRRLDGSRIFFYGDAPGRYEEGGHFDQCQDGYILRSLNKDTSQIYVAEALNGWPHYYKAHGIGGTRYSVTNISKEVYTDRYGQKNVKCIETVGIRIANSELNELAQKDSRLSLKLYGKGFTRTISLPAHYIKGYLTVVNRAFSKD